MKRFFTMFGAMMLAIAGFAQITGELNPSGGIFYPDDAINQNKISAEYSAPILATNASAVFTAEAYSQTVTDLEVFANGFFIPVPPTMPDGAFTVVVSGVTDADGLSVASLTGTYTYRSVFPLKEVSPLTGTTLTSKSTTVVFTFNENVTYTSVEITSGSVVTKLDGSTTGVKSVSVPLNENYWGTPIGGINNISVALKNVMNSEGTLISNSSGNVGTIASYYTYEETSASVEFLGTDPEPEWTYAEDILGWDVTFKYSDTVVMGDANATAVIGYYDVYDDLLLPPVNVPSSEIGSGTNPREGYFGLFVPVATIEDEYLPDLSYLTITVKGLIYNDAAVATQTIRYDVAPTTYKAPATRGIGTDGATAIEQEKVNADKLVNIYSIQGLLLKKGVPATTVNTLEKGLYIVGGKKVFVK